MSAPTSRGLLVAAAVVLLVGSTASVAVADLGADRPLAQDDENATETTTANESAESAPSGAQNDSSGEVVREVDSTVRVTGYGYNASSETFRLEFENTGDRSKRVTITEALTGDSAGEGRFGVEVVTVRPGRTLTVHVALHTGSETPGVMIVTDESVEQGHGTYLTVEDEDDGGLFDGVPTWWDVWAGIGASIGFMAVVSVVGVWRVVARESNDVAEVNV